MRGWRTLKGVVSQALGLLFHPRLWEDFWMEAGHRVEFAVRVQMALSAEGIRCWYQVVGPGVRSGGSSAGQTVKVLVYRDDLYRARGFGLGFATVDERCPPGRLAPTLPAFVSPMKGSYTTTEACRWSTTRPAAARCPLRNAPPLERTPEALLEGRQDGWRRSTPQAA